MAEGIFGDKASRQPRNCYVTPSDLLASLYFRNISGVDDVLLDAGFCVFLVVETRRGCEYRRDALDLYIW